MLEFLSGSFVYSLVKDTWAFLRGRKRRLNETEVLALRAKWQSEIEQQLWKRRKDRLSDDIIVRDVGRIDSYPDIDARSKGISPWFKAGLVGTYHRGILIGLQWYGLKKVKENVWRRVNYEANEKADTNALLVGYVRYENIESINWNGDEFYGEPHIYCHFVEKSKQPYERISYCEQRKVNEFTYYSEIADYDAVRKLSKKHGVR